MAGRKGELTTVPTNSRRAGNLLPDSNPDAGVPVKSYARANQELAAAFVRYLQIRGFRPSTQVSYGKSLRWLVESIGSASIVGADHLEIRQFLGELLDRGVCSNTIRRHTASLRCFFRFLQLGELPISRICLPRPLGRRKQIIENAPLFSFGISWNATVKPLSVCL